MFILKIRTPAMGANGQTQLNSARQSALGPQKLGHEIDRCDFSLEYKK